MHSAPAAPKTSARLDRHDVYIGVLIALWLAGLGISLVPIGVGAISYLDAVTQKLLAWCMLVGTTIALMGAGAGDPAIWVFRFIRRLARIRGLRWVRHLEPTLALRHAYLFGAGGLISVDIGLGWFGYAVISNGTVVGSATGAMTPILFIVYLKLTRKFIGEYRRMTREFEVAKAALLGKDSDGVG